MEKLLAGGVSWVDAGWVGIESEKPSGKPLWIDAAEPRDAFIFLAFLLVTSNIQAISICADSWLGLLGGLALTGPAEK